MQYLIIYKFEFEIIPLAAVFPISASVAVFFSSQNRLICHV